MDGEAWRAIVHGVTESQTQLSNLPFHFSSYKPYMHIYACNFHTEYMKRYE